MNNRANPMPDDHQDQRETPFGTLYRPKSIAAQLVALIGSFLCIPAMGWLLSSVLGGLSASSQIIVAIPFFLIFALGYGLWLSRLQTLVFKMIGKPLLRVLFNLLVKRKKPDKPENIFPSKEKIEEIAVRGQRAASSFLIASIPVAAFAGLSSLFFELRTGVLLRVCVVSGCCLLWGWFLTSMGRRGYLPFPEEGH